VNALLQIFLICFAGSAFAQNMNLPVRDTNAPDGNSFAQKISALNLTERESAIVHEILAGNVPAFLRKFVPVTVTNISDGKTNIATFFAAPDYLAVGSDENYFLTPVSPNTAQGIADKLGCVLPTRKMVDAIYASAEVKLAPSPIPPSPAMTTVPIFAQHNETVRTQRAAFLSLHPLGALVAGHKKDVVISARLLTVTNKVAIYGWHQTNGVAIQPLYLGHVSWWVDYSQCIRLISRTMLVNGERKTVAEALADPKLCGLISDEGVVTNVRYRNDLGSTGLRPVVSGVAPETGGERGLELKSTNHQQRTPPAEIRRDAGFDGRDARATNETINLPWPQKFLASTNFAEMIREIQLPDEARILVNTPARESFAANKPVLLVFYALPNGNTIEQTIGKTLQPGEDWHFNIQHIGAQTRWLRNEITNRTIVVAYLEAGMKSWPAWRKKYSDHRIVAILDGVRGIFSANKTEVVLASHSGGGSLVFGYLNAVEKIPDDVKRIAFLDSNYGYDSKLHADKIKSWLAAAGENRLCVLAYQDYLGLLNGKSFVSEVGGTWGRSQVMLGDLGAQFQFTSRTNAGLETFSTLDGRIEFLMKENPEHKIFHTVQVERNGFIQALVSGTADEGKGYEYFGARAYTKWIQGE
jgi:hypothetical protein